MKMDQKDNLILGSQACQMSSWLFGPSQALGTPKHFYLSLVYIHSVMYTYTSDIVTLQERPDLKHVKSGGDEYRTCRPHRSCQH